MNDSFEHLEAALGQLNSPTPQKGAKYLESMLGRLAHRLKLKRSPKTATRY